MFNFPGSYSLAATGTVFSTPLIHKEKCYPALTNIGWLLLKDRKKH